MKESKLQNYVKKYYENGGRMVYKTMGGFVKGANYTAAPGWPDLMVFGAGEKMFFIECKNETGKLRDTQIVRIFELQRMGYLVEIARPSEKNVVSKFKLEDVKITRSEYLKALENIEKHKELKKLKRLEAKLNEQKKSRPRNGIGRTFSGQNDYW